LVASRQCVSDWRYISLSKFVVESNLTGTAGRFGSGNFFPLYLYTEKNGQHTIEQTAERTPNLNAEIVKQLAEKLGLAFTNEKETTKNTFAPIDILDYIYAVLHSPSYREKYKEFLKIDFPRVPYPNDTKTFWQFVALGGELREIHLLESPTVEKYITQYPEDGNNIVTKPIYKDGNVYINETQYFANVPQVAWDFYIGGYQPAQKWLKDRKERELTYEDILHYQKIIVALSETDRIMIEVDKIYII
jgi:predicted helicase